MNTRTILVSVIIMFAVASLVGADVLNGIPGGDFSVPYFADGYPGILFPPEGTWTFWASANAAANVVGDGVSRHAELSTGWYPYGASFWYTDPGQTPLNSPWKISADLKLYSGNVGANRKYFEIGYNWVISGSADFYMEFSNESTANGYLINWHAGSQTGTYYSAASIVNNYATVSFEYDPVTGHAVGRVGNEVVFDEIAGSGIAVNQIYFYNNQPVADANATLCIDNIRAVAIPPVVQIWEPGLDENEVYTGTTGLNLIRIGWSQAVNFSSSDISIKDASNNSIPFSVTGTGSKIMTINLGQTLFKNKYTIVVSDSVANLQGTAIDGDEDGMEGGDKVLVVEHRMRPDSNGDNKLNFVDFANFAIDWLWSK